MFRDELILAIMAEELSHELTAPVSFLDGLIHEIGRGSSVDAEDLSIASEELERLRALLCALRRVRLPELPTTTLRLIDLVDAAAEATTSLRHERHIAWTREIPADLTLEVHRSYAELVLAPLMRAALGCVADGGGLSAVATSPGGAPALDLRLHLVERDLPRAALPWAAWPNPDFDVMLARRIARAHGHHIEQQPLDGGPLLRLRLARAATRTAHPITSGKVPA